jgi:hypothetical protein
MARGGYQQPPARTGPSGPGRFSKRTDGQPVQVPNVGDSSDLQYGDRTMLENAQKAVPIPKGGQPAPRPAGAPLGPGPMPGHLIGPSNRPGEPVTTGLGMGPGAGPEALNAPPNTPDVREQVLAMMMQNYGNSSAAKMLAGIRAERQTPTTPSPGAPPTPGAAPPTPEPGPAGPQMGAPQGAQGAQGAPPSG